MNECLWCRLPILDIPTWQEIFGFEPLIPSNICQRCLKQFPTLPPLIKSKQDTVLSEDDPLKSKEIEANDHQTLGVHDHRLFDYQKAMVDFEKQYEKLGHFQLSRLFSRQLYLWFYRHHYELIILIPASRRQIKQIGYDPVLSLYQTVRPNSTIFRRDQADRLQIKKAKITADQILLLSDFMRDGEQINQARKLVKQKSHQAVIDSFCLA